MEVGKGNAALAPAPTYQYARLEHRERDAHVGGVDRDAVLARAEDCVHSIDAVDRRAAAAGFALIAWGCGVVEIKAARSLQQVASGRGHVAQLLRSSGENGAAQQRIARLDLRVVRKVAVGNQGADAQAAICRLLDLRKRQTRDVDEARWARDILLDEIDEIGAAGNELGAGVGRDLAHRIGDVIRPTVAEIVHGARSLCPALPNITSLMAATMSVRAPQRQIFPLISSRISSAVRALPSAMSPIAEQIWPGVQ